MPKKLRLFFYFRYINIWSHDKQKARNRKVLEKYLFKMPIKSRELGPCLVCCNAAIGINFGVPTCMACKAFFRRNAVKIGVG
jgi:hypothetical protein